MRVIHALESVKLADVVLTIGTFDGVHRGHQTILAAGRKRADEERTQLVAIYHGADECMGGAETSVNDLLATLG